MYRQVVIQLLPGILSYFVKVKKLKKFLGDFNIALFEKKLIKNRKIKISKTQIERIKYFWEDFHRFYFQKKFSFKQDVADSNNFTNPVSLGCFKPPDNFFFITRTNSRWLNLPSPKVFSKITSFNLKSTCYKKES